MLRKTTALTLFSLAVLVAGQDGLDELANDAADDSMDAAPLDDESNSIADSVVSDAKIAVPETTQDDEEYEDDIIDNDWRYWEHSDKYIGATTCLQLVWWFVWGWFIYIRTNASDNTVRDYSWEDGTTFHALPISWFWQNTNTAGVGYQAMAYLFIWLFYLIVGVPEFIFWMMFMLENEDTRCEGASGFWLYNMWASYVGLYGSWILYSGTILMPILQLATLGHDIYKPTWTNSIAQIVVMTIGWLATGIIHILFVPALNQSWEDECNAPLEPETETMEDSEAKVMAKDSEPVVDEEGNDWD